MELSLCLEYITVIHTVGVTKFWFGWLRICAYFAVIIKVSIRAIQTLVISSTLYCFPLFLSTLQELEYRPLIAPESAALIKVDDINFQVLMGKKTPSDLQDRAIIHTLCTFHTQHFVQ